MRKWLILACLAALLTGCDGRQDEDSDFSILADPVRGHAPSKVSFSIIREDGSSLDGCKATWKFGDDIMLSGTVEAEHKYKAPGNYEVDVKLTCNGEEMHATTGVTVYDPIDLSLASLESRPLNVSTEGSIEWSVQVMNLEDNPLRVPTNLDFYLTPVADDIHAAGSTRLYRHILNEFPAASAPNSTQKLEFSVPVTSSLRTGSYYAVAVINPDGEVGEMNLSNNLVTYGTPITVRNQSTDGADLEAVRLQMTPEITHILSSATATFEVLNQGSTTAEAISYEIWMSAKNNAEDMTDAVLVSQSHLEGSVSGVRQAYQDILVSITPPVTEPGLYYFWLVLDSDGTITERNEDNNVVRSAAPIQVTDDPVLDADILVQSVKFTPETTGRGSTFSVSVDIYNQGTQPTGSFVCTVFLSSDMALDVNTDRIVGSINVADLHPTTSLQRTTSVEVDGGIDLGQYYVYTFCDSSGVVAEANEDNNIQRSDTQITVVGDLSTDLLIGQTSKVTPNTPEDGDEVRVTLQVCNNGTTGAGPSIVSLERNNLCDGTHKEVARQTVDGLDAKTCQLVNLTFAQVCDFWCSAYDFTAVADAAKQISETNEVNNRLELNNTLATSGVNCICSSDRFESNDVMTAATTATSLDEALTLCPRDEDWFRLDLKNNDSFTAHVSHDATRSPLTFEMWRDNTMLRRDFGSDELFLEGTLLTNVDLSPVYLRVYGENGAANHYHLTLNTKGISNTVDLAASDLVVDGNALSMAEKRAITVMVANLGEAASPVTNLVFYLSRTGDLDETASRLAAVQVPSLAAASSRKFTVNLQLPADTPTGDYHVIAKVGDEATFDDADLSNNIAHSAAWSLDKTCWDEYDPNETAESASHLILTDGEPLLLKKLKVCQQNEDIYRFEVKNGQSLSIAVTAQTAGDFDVVLYDYNFNEVASSRTSSATETITQDLIVGDQTMFLKVFLLNNLYNTNDLTYDLSITTGAGPAWLNCSGLYEPNNFFSSALDLRTIAASGAWLELCPSYDDDYYAIDLVAGQKLSLKFETSAQRLRASLFGGADQHFIAMLTNLQTQDFNYLAPQSGTYWVRVFTNASTDEALPYRLVMDTPENLDYAVSALSISPERVVAGQNLTVSFTVSNTSTHEGTYTYGIHIDDATHHELLYVSTEPASIAPGASPVTHRQKVTIPSAYEGKVTISVELSVPDDGDRSNNTISHILEVAPSCQADTYEPNNNALGAQRVTSPVKATICEGDEDWYIISPVTDASVTLSFDHTTGDLDLYVYDADGKEVGRSVTADDEESVPVSASSTYYVLVKGNDSFVRNDYTLTF